MPTRNIHSLSLSLFSTSLASDVARRTHQGYDTPDATPPTEACTGPNQLPYAAQASLKPDMMSRDGRNLGHHHHNNNPSTIFQRGLVTPNTPCYTPTVDNSADPRSSCQLSIPSAPANIPSLDSIMSPDTPESPDDDFDISFEEFEKRYVPMSHLPTPPPSSCKPTGLPVNEKGWSRRLPRL